MRREKRTWTRKTYRVLLPNKEEPQELDFRGLGWTGSGLKGRIAEHLGIDRESIRLFVGEQEIPNHEVVHEFVDEDQVIRVVIETGEK